MSSRLNPRSSGGCFSCVTIIAGRFSPGYNFWNVSHHSKKFQEVYGPNVDRSCTGNDNQIFSSQVSIVHNKVISQYHPVYRWEDD